MSNEIENATEDIIRKIKEGEESIQGITGIIYLDKSQIVILSGDLPSSVFDDLDKIKKDIINQSKIVKPSSAYGKWGNA